MKGSIQRVRDVINGRLPDRPPLYELFRNDAVINHFTGRTLTVENGPELVFHAYEPAVDATRPRVRPPDREEIVVLDDGRTQRHFRWTAWTEHRVYDSSEAWAAAKKSVIASHDPAWSPAKQVAMDGGLQDIETHRRKLGEVFFFPSGPGLGLMSIFGEVGLEHFAYYLQDCPGIIDDLLECNTLSAIAWIDHLPADHGIEAVISGDDIACNFGPLLSPAWFATHYFERLSRVISAYHRKGVKVLFHSDGNLNAILGGLVDAGIDGLNPIEVLAGMDVADIHHRYPDLFLAGAVDVSQLLPFGSPEEVGQAVRKALDDAEGTLMVGSSTELNDAVPLENYLALRDAVLGYTY